MAIFKKVNAAIRKAYPDKDIEVVNGRSYVYFDVDDGFDQIKSIWVHPNSVTTETLIRLCLETIESSLEETNQ